MKYVIPNSGIAVIIAATALWAGPAAASTVGESELKIVTSTQSLSGGDDQPSVAPVPATPATPAAPAVAPVPSQDEIVIQTIEPDGKNKRGKEVTWLGLAVEEASEALSAQLGLKTGEGLTVFMLAAESPAAKADLHKNDVLVELDGQMLVHPMQLRKLVQMHAEGDTVKITFYRGGKKQTASVKLGKTIWEEANDTEMTPMPSDLQHLNLELKGLSGDLRGMSESLARVGLDKAKVNLEVKRTMEQTRKAIQDAMQRASIDRKSLTSVDRELEAMARGGVDVDKDATVIVRNRHNSTRTIVETDDNGTYIIEAGKKTHLTARNKHGKLLFEGEIDTPEEQAKVPKEVWEKAKPMFDQIAAPNDSAPKSEDSSGDKPNP
jgi:hypothetical protein